MFLRCFPFMCALALGLFLNSTATAQFNNMAAAAPDGANVLMMVNLESLMSSPLAKKENWRGKFDAAYTTGLTAVPSDTTHVLVASQVDLQFLKPIWELAVFERSTEPSMSAIARQTKGKLDSFSGVEAVALPGDTYIVKMTDQRLAAYTPANRQAIARWLSSIKQRSAVSLSPYLASALEKARAGDAAIVQALDLEFAIPANAIRERLDTRESLKTSKVDLDKLAALLATMRGVTLSVRVGDDIQGSVTLDFGDDASLLANIGKPLLLESLEGWGATIEDLEQWTMKVQGTQAIYSGKLTSPGLRKLLSLVEQQTPHITDGEKEQPAPGESEKERTIAASKQYFKSIQSLLRDCKADHRKAETISKGALWLERYAGRIDKLPVLGVDKDLLKYGQDTATVLRSMASTIRSSGARTTARELQVYDQGAGYINSGYDPGSYGGHRYAWGNAYFEWNPVQSQRTAIRADERNTQAQFVIQASSAIADATQKIRHLMTDRYASEF